MRATSGGGAGAAAGCGAPHPLANPRNPRMTSAAARTPRPPRTAGPSHTPRRPTTRRNPNLTSGQLLRLAVVLVRPDEDRPREGVGEEVEAEERGGGALRQLQRLDVDGVHDEVVVVHAVPGGWGRAEVAVEARVVGEGD